MPAGAAPGERRGGRAKGTPNKATEAERSAEAKALDEAFLLLGPVVIKGMSPARVMRYAMETLLLAGFSHAALVLADKVAPYFDAKLAPLVVEPPQEAEEERARRLHEAILRHAGVCPGNHESAGKQHSADRKQQVFRRPASCPPTRKDTPACQLSTPR